MGIWTESTLHTSFFSLKDLDLTCQLPAGSSWLASRNHGPCARRGDLGLARPFDGSLLIQNTCVEWRCETVLGCRGRRTRRFWRRKMRGSCDIRKAFSRGSGYHLTIGPISSRQNEDSEGAHQASSLLAAGNDSARFFAGRQGR